jgi:hypothetical protein
VVQEPKETNWLKIYMSTLQDEKLQTIAKHGKYFQDSEEMIWNKQDDSTTGSSDATIAAASPSRSLTLAN